MKVILKTTTGRSTEVEFQAGTTIAQVKDTLKDEYDLASLRLCYQGKILDDAKNIDELGEGAALFIAGKKVTATKPAASAPATTTVTETPKATPTEPQQPSQTPPAQTASTTVVREASPVVTPTPTSNVTAPPAASNNELSVDEDLINNIAAMGFEDRDLVKLALRAAYMNPDRAVDYLCQGMPRSTLERLANDAAPRTNVAPTNTAPAGNRAPAPSNPGTSNPTDALRQALASIPNFDQVRQVVQQNPQSLPTFMQQLQQNHPEVFALVQQNPQAFLELLQSSQAGEPSTDDVGPTSVRLTPEDQVAIQELAAIGGGAWDLQAATLVYIAVNKNKEVAAAVLFEHGGLPPQLVQALLDHQAQGGAGQDDDEGDDAYE